MSKYLNIIPATPLTLDKNQVFTYSVPKEIKTNIKTGCLVKINMHGRNLNGIVESIAKTKPSYKIKDIASLIDEKPILTKEQLKLAKWMADYYWVSLGLIIKTMVPKIAPRILAKDIVQDNDKNIINKSKISLTKKQKYCISQISNSKNNKPFLLYGVTSSGKTEVYLELIEKTLKQNKQAIILLPEISLTPQAIQRYSQRFNKNMISLLHSRLSYGKYFENWNNFRLGKTKILIGTRNAIFCPFQNLGLIVIDEEHDPSFKSWDMNPHFDAREVAGELSKLTKAKLLLGTATPSVESYFKTEKNQYNLLELPEKINKDIKATIKLIDMRAELEKRNFSIFSEELQESIKNILAKKQQGLLFINRRGAASYVLCRDCGYVENCPNCEKSLTYHLNSNLLICHSCGFKKTPPLLCPKCKSPRIKFVGSGTQKVEEELKKLFKNIRVARLDVDTPQEYEEIYNDFKDKKVDIVIGTQMATKNWDFPNLTLVGIINADNLLNIADYQTNEISFSLIAQACGRTARPGSKGEQKIVIQTYNPENNIIQLAAYEKFKEFYKTELAERKQFKYPPFVFLIKFTYMHKDKKIAEHEINKLWKHLNKLNELNEFNDFIEIKKPITAMIPRIREKYIYELVLKTKKWIPHTTMQYPLENFDVNYN